MKLQLTLSLAAFALSTPSLIAAADASSIAWSYHEDDTDALGPSHWGDGYPSCTGQSQSPIDIQPKYATDACDQQLPISFSGDCVSFGLKMYDETFKWETTDTTCKAHVGSKTYSLAQFHLHMPAEHTINGKQYESEAHFVHKEDGGDQLLVFGLLLTHHHHRHHHHHEENMWINAVWNTLAHMNQTVDVEHSYADLLLEKIDERKVYNYAGSLTAPPCSEIVDWWVIQEPLHVSKESLKQFKELLATLEATDDGNSARAVQPLNDREVIMY